MITRLVSLAAVAGVATLAVAAPATAAATPTLQAGAAEIVGYHPVTLTGTAEPGSKVALYETAIGLNDFQPAIEYDDPAHLNEQIVLTADAAGKFTVSRYLDTGFRFQVRQGSAVSNTVTVYSRLAVGLSGSSPSAGRADLTAWNVPGQPGLAYQFQQRQADGSWKTVRTGVGAANGAFLDATLTGLAAGTYTYRAHVAGDAAQGVRDNYSKTVTVTVKGAATGPKPGSVQFTKIRYDSTGADTGTNASLNAEWVKLTNKTGTRINLSGWQVRDAQNIVYTFTGTVYLNAGASLFVQTGKGTNTATNRFWGRAGKGGYVWNNGGDTAQLRTANGVTIDACKWAIVGTGETTC
ncbi:hypothetical protein Ade02nite_86200 [Paractinoplanes deccanensis]|uniref:LTD domain-containing protein n=1 Tax=Paractinoplanes deccanensis TaxID=113561 RepID=A0ABQ3YJ03_9ACTN|nr:lamin tail domain-containing protein [Actinoplanes deccanensis]GID79979.1 hypothetical protein Ade02nite_86200 [Actinoplanes deccanensis]